jgi:hypothetical protein
MAHFRPMLARHDITEQQWRVLRVLAETGPVEATELANRASILPPSPAGLALIEDLSPERATIYEAIERRYGADQQERLLDLLEGLIQSESAADQDTVVPD